MRITWNGRGLSKRNLKKKTKVKKERILLKLFHLLHLHPLLLLQVQVQNPLQENIDVKFELPMYDSEVNAKRLDNWVRQMEVYYSVQQIKDKATQVKLASLCLLGTTII